MELLRSLIFVPGNRANMLERAREFNADVIMVDLEDSVPPGEKVNARAMAREWAPQLVREGRKIMVRCNSLDTGLTRDEAAAVIGPHLFGISVGKTESVWDLQEIDRIIGPLESAAGMSAGAIKVIPWIESAKAVMNAQQMALASPRVIALAFGAEDFTNDMGIQRTDDGAEVYVPRATTAIVARAGEVASLDSPYVAFRNPEGLAADAQAAPPFTNRPPSRTLPMPGRWWKPGADAQAASGQTGPKPVGAGGGHRAGRRLVVSQLWNRKGKGGEVWIGRQSSPSTLHKSKLSTRPSAPIPTTLPMPGRWWKPESSPSTLHKSKLSTRPSAPRLSPTTLPAHLVGDAREVVEAWSQAEAAGRGSLDLHGKMVDVPVVKRAQNLLALVEATSRPWERPNCRALEENPRPGGHSGRAFPNPNQILEFFPLFRRQPRTEFCLTTG